MAVLVLHEAVSSSISTYPEWRKQILGSNNAPTVVWTFRDDSTINLVLESLFSIRCAHNRLHMLTMPMFYHTILLNTMDNDATRRFELSTNSFLELLCYKYPPQSTDS